MGAPDQMRFLHRPWRGVRGEATIALANSLVAGEDIWVFNGPQNATITRDTGTPANDTGGVVAIYDQTTDRIDRTGPSKKYVVGPDGNLWYASHNIFDDPDNPATQSITVQSGIDYKVKITGAGSITLSGAGAGTVTDGSPVEFTASTASLTCTIVGSVDTAQVFATPADETYLGGTGASRHAQPITHLLSTLTSSTSPVTIGLGEKTFTTVASGTFSAGKNVSMADQGNVYGNRMTGTVVSHIGTTLVVNVDHFSGSGSISSWHIIEIAGVLYEPGSTNLAEDGEDFTQWSNAATLDVTAAATTAPNGENTASAIGDDGSTGNGRIHAGIAVTVSTSTEYVFSFHGKEKQLSWGAIRTLNFTSPGNVYSHYDFGAGSLGTAGSGHTARIDSVSNDFYRSSIAFTTHSSDTAGILRIHPADADGDVEVDWDGTSDIYVWGGQFEQNSVPTSYIHTSGSTISRAADDDSKALSELPYSSGAGSLVLSFTPEAEDFTLISLDDGTANNRIEIYASAGDLKKRIIDGGSTEVDDTIGSITAGTAHKVALAWDTNDVRACLDGTLDTQDTGVTLPTGLTTLNLAQNYAASDHYHGIFDYAKIRDRRISDTDMQTEAPA